MPLVTLIIATIVGCSGLLTKPLQDVMGWLVCGGESAEEKRLLQGVASVRRSLQNISMADQFAAWAKRQREINALTLSYQQKAGERQARDQRLRTICSLAVNIVIALLSLWYVWSCSGSSVVSFPPQLLSPLTSLLAVPGCAAGEVSVVVWLACIRSVSGRLAASFSKGKPSSGGGSSLRGLWSLIS